MTELDIYKKALDLAVAIYPLLTAQDFLNYAKDSLQEIRLSKAEKTRLKSIIEALLPILSWNNNNHHKYTHISFHTKPITHIRLYRNTETGEVYDSIASRPCFTQHMQDGKRYKISELLGEEYD